MFDSTLSNNAPWSLDHLNAALDPILLSSTSDSTGISVQNQSSSNYGFDEKALLQTASALSRQSSLSTGNELSTLSSTLADLIIPSASAGDGVTGSNYNFSYTIKNQGSSVAGYSYTDFYLSKNTSWDSGDTYLGYDYVSSLAAGASTTESVSVYLDNGIQSGTYYLLLYADADGNVTESNESNNNVYLTKQITISGDNAGNTLSTAKAITLGSSTTTYSDWVGSTDTNDYYKFSLSNTSNFNLSLTNLSNNAEIQLLNSSGTKITESVNSGTNNEGIIRQLPAGTYYIRVYPYSGNTNYNLNVSATPTPQPDLNINSINATTGVIGSPLNFTYTIKNQGNAAAGASSTAFYLSTNTTLDSSDTYLGVDGVASLAAGASSTESASFTLANTLSPGTYYLLAKADNGNSVIESNENNNLVYRTSPITLQSPTTISISASDANASETNTGQTANLGQFTLTRTGNLTNSLTVNYGISGTATNGTDYNKLTGSVTFAAGASTATINVTPINDTLSEQIETVIATLSTGTGYILGTNKSATVNLADNDFAITVTSPNGGEKLNLGSSYNITWTDNISENVKISLYKGGTYLRTLFDSTPSDGSESWTVANDLTPGSDYQIWVGSVSNNSVFDSSNANFSTVIPPRPDLVIQNASAPTTANIGGSITVSYNLKNQGQGTAVGIGDTRFYLSKDATVSADDIYLAAAILPSSLQIKPGKFSTRSITIDISNSLTAGTYYLFYHADGSKEVVESNENNNLAYVTLKIPVYSSTSGYGLVNAAAAVAKAINKNPFPNVPTWGAYQDWGANMIKAPEVWAKGYTGQGITVAVLDTGVDYNHIDLKGNIWSNTDEIAGDGIDNDNNGYVDDVRGWDFVYGDNNPMDEHSHGTHVAGTIAASRNSFGVTGIAYNAKIMPVRVLGDGTGANDPLVEGIYYAVNNGAKVINMSLSWGFSDGYEGYNELQTAIKYAASKGVISIMAAGNDFDDDNPDIRAKAVKPMSPGVYATNWGMVVGAVDEYNYMADFSNRAGSNSSMAYVTAPGDEYLSWFYGGGINSTLPGNDYGYLRGTSMAAPHVAGVVALMLSAKPNLTDAQVRQILTSTAAHNA